MTTAALGVKQRTVFSEHVFLPRLNGKREAILIRWQRTVEGIGERTRWQNRVVEVQRDRAIGVGGKKKKTSHAVGGLAACGISEHQLQCRARFESGNRIVRPLVVESYFARDHFIPCDAIFLEVLETETFTSGDFLPRALDDPFGDVVERINVPESLKVF